MFADRIFLNTFGFILEEVEAVNESSRVKIYDKSMNKVGELYFDNGQVIMTAKYCDSKLAASCDIAKAFGFVDKESDNALFAQWSSRIDLKIKNNNFNIKGNLLVDNTADTQFGICWQCQPLLTLNIPNKGNITLKFLRDWYAFYFDLIQKTTTRL